MKIWSNALIVSLIMFVLVTGCKDGTQKVHNEVSNKTENVTPAASKAEENTLSPDPASTALPATTPDLKLPKRDPQSAPLDVFQQAKQLGRGVNLGNALEAPIEGQWGVILQESYFKTIKDTGFETVRVPIKWSAHAEAEAPYAIDANFVERIDWVIDQALKQGLNVVLDMHNFDEIYPNPDEHEARFLALWKQISARYKELPGNVYYELLNEPHGSLSWSKWNRMLKKALDTIRIEDQWHTVIIGSVNWSNYADLASLDIPDNEQNVVVTFHYYDPFLFTHQGAEWGGPEVGTIGVTWPGPPPQSLEPIEAAKQVQWVNDWFEDYNRQPVESNPAGPQSIVEAFDKVDNWAKEHHRPIYLGEFGAYSKADMPSRARWTTFVREEADRRGFSWAYWEFSSGFGVYDPIANQFRKELLEALIPHNLK
ncbi:glycoside hydrolase family 5 protein [Paenibacillus sp. CF384]|uniref:glycoside hydrolase family 5 protein n=1 Tax=Paenibacillus sp. CF384 TaxID=1884382 RepID=UPI000897555C|nr:glycoside hydrolase family 5 protein [Paenibacillus sp. CF384]SDW08759.1 Cellulase family 5 [Paenibacillus sp. CF384]